MPLTPTELEALVRGCGRYRRAWRRWGEGLWTAKGTTKGTTKGAKGEHERARKMTTKGRER